MSLSLDGTTGISASGNITGGNVIASGSLVVGSFAPASVSTAGNVTGGNILTGGLISSTGNVTGAYLFGNASTVTGLSASKIFNGTSEANIGTSGGNANISIGGTSNVFVVSSTGIFTTGLSSITGNITAGNISATNHTGTTVSVTGAVTGASVVGGVITGTSLSLSGNTTAGNILTGGLISATGNISSAGNISCGNIIMTGILIDTVGNLEITSQFTNGNVNLIPNGTGNVYAGGNLMPTGNATANIGSATSSWNTVFAKATSAQYADLAEMYCADSEYTPGTVLEFGGSDEVTITTQSHSTQIAGIVSTNPSYLMNSTLNCDNAVQVALVGRVPCSVVGTIAKGDRLVASTTPGIATRLDMSQYQPGCIVGKALEDYDSETAGIIEVAVGRI